MIVIEPQQSLQYRHNQLLMSQIVSQFRLPPLKSPRAVQIASKSSLNHHQCLVMVQFHHNWSNLITIGDIQVRIVSAMSQIHHKWSKFNVNRLKLHCSSPNYHKLVSQVYKSSPQSAVIVAMMQIPLHIVSRCRIGATVCLTCTESIRHELKGILSSCPFHSVGAVNSYNSLTPRRLDFKKFQWPSFEWWEALVRMRTSCAP